MDDLRRPFFIAALILMLLVVLIEIGSGFALHGQPSADAMAEINKIPLPAPIKDALGDVDSGQVQQIASGSSSIPGYGIPYMAILDGMVLFTVGLVASSMVITDTVQGRFQGCATLILSIVLIITALALIITAILLLLLMIALLLAVPFGTIVYFALYGFFDRGSASAVLSVLMLLKLGFAGCLLLAQQRFLQNRGLILLVISSLIATIVVSFLQGLVPGFLVSITDNIAGIIVALCGCVWWVLALIGAIPAILRVIRK